MSEQPNYDYLQLSQLYATVEQAKDVRELLARTHKTLLGRVQDQLSALKDAMLAMEDPASAEFKAVHMRARVLGALFAELAAVINDAEGAAAMIAENEAGKIKDDQGEEL